MSTIYEVLRTLTYYPADTVCAVDVWFAKDVIDSLKVTPDAFTNTTPEKLLNHIEENLDANIGLNHEVIKNAFDALNAPIKTYKSVNLASVFTDTESPPLFRALLNDCLYALNQLPRQPIPDSEGDDTYKLASKIDEALKINDNLAF